MKLVYTRKAAAELADVLNYIDLRSVQGQQNVSRRLREMIEMALAYPEAGRSTSKKSIRRLAVAPYPYVIFYSVTNTAVVIHGIRHASRKPLY